VARTGGRKKNDYGGGSDCNLPKGLICGGRKRGEGKESTLITLFPKKSHFPLTLGKEPKPEDREPARTIPTEEKAWLKGRKANIFTEEKGS